MPPVAELVKLLADPIDRVRYRAKLELAGLVGTHEVGKLSPGMSVQVKVEGSDEPVTARIARIAPAAEPGTRSIGVTLTLDNPGERFRAGQ